MRVVFNALTGPASGPELNAHNGQIAEAVPFTEEDEADIVDVGDMFHLTFADGFKCDAFQDEIKGTFETFPGATVYAIRPDVYFLPFIDHETGRVGYVVRTNAPDNDQRETYIYFNPSGEDDDGEATVFVYIGGENDPSLDMPHHYYPLNEDLGLLEPTDDTVEPCPGCPAPYDGEGCCGHPMPS